MRGIVFKIMKLLKEGKVEFYAPQGDITKKLPVFYNPHMVFDRDLTVAIASAFGGSRYADTLAGSGIRGMRAAKEAGFSEVFFNDNSEDAVELIKKNLKQNKIEGDILCEDINHMLRRFKCDKLDVIDIDPFGSSIVALDSALRAINRKHGLLCMTFTDTAPLCGVSVKTCQRRYDARPLRVSYAKEIGLRILIGACVRMAGKYDFSLRPLFSYNRRHYFRLFLKTENGVSAADKMLENMAYLQHCYKCDWREYARIPKFKDKCPTCGSSLDWAGPLWAGEFADPNFCAKIASKISSENNEVEKLTKLISGEQKVLLPYYDVHHLSEIKKTVAPKKKNMIRKLISKNNRATETHFCRTGIRSSAYVDLF